ncbi:transglutaminase domain-containing protein [Bariatricus sp. HCP28S3_C2]|uniref:transglutaminase domain-containing protein n=1 Tax=unclassified Bariatricus TaxID=2677046 RepID=UPI003F89473C
MGRRNRRKKKSGCLGAVTVFLCFAAGLICLSAAYFLRNPNAFEVVGFLSTESGKDDVPLFEEVRVTEEEMADGFYYGLLETEEEKTVYKEIYQGLMEEKEHISLHASGGELANAIFLHVLNDHPEIFWCDGNAVSTSYSETILQEAYVDFAPKYLCTGEEKERKKQEIDAAAGECLAAIQETASDYEKIKSVYEYLIQTVEYNLDAPDNQNIYSALAGKESVCAGYARSTQYLLNRLGIVCAYVTGTTTDADGNTEDHAWNMVRCEGEWYFVDTTWGDPMFQQEEEQVASRAMTYDYLCCTEDMILRTHTLKEGYDYPECGPDRWNYYRMNGMFYESYERDTLLEAMYDSIDAGEASVIFKFVSDAVYEQAHDAVTGELVQEGASYLGRMYGLREVHYSYVEEPLLDKLTIYWNYS